MAQSTDVLGVTRDEQSSPQWRSSVAGMAAGTCLVVLLSLVMIPFRSHLSVATAALVLVVPVVAGAALGGFPAGVAVTALGFLAYDFFFIPPYYRLYVGAGQNWVALVVYVAVMIVVTQLVARMETARLEARVRAEDSRRLLDLSETLVRDASAHEVHETVVTTVSRAFGLSSAALLLPEADGLSLASSTGIALSAGELNRVAASGVPVSIERPSGDAGGVQVVALVTSGRAVGLLALKGLPRDRRSRELLRAFTNQLALALERSELREQAVRVGVLEETERLGRALIGAVSHDLRTPLATIKVATSTLLDNHASVGTSDRDELIGLIDAQADRLDRLVANLLDVTRIRSGTLELRPEVLPVSDLIDQALALLDPVGDRSGIEIHLAEETPDVEVDPLLVRQVLVNLVDNALRYAPDGSPVRVSAQPAGQGAVEIAVADSGPGVEEDEMVGIFQMMNTRDAGGRAGLGLVIVKAFVEAHGQHVRVERPEGGQGARFVFTLPAVRAGRIEPRPRPVGA